MDMMRWSALVLLAAIGVLSPSAAFADPIVGQVDDFEDGTTQGWTVNFAGMAPPPADALPTVVSTGGPGGAADSFLMLTSLGGNGPGSRLSVGNLDPRWTGDYLAAGVRAITMDVNNFGSTELALRLAFEDPTAGPPSNVAFSTDALIVPTGSGWMTVTFLIGPGDLTAGLGDVDAALTGATLIRLYHSPDPNFPNPVSPIPAVVAQLGIDNIAVVPEPASLVLTVTGLIGLCSSIRRRRSS
ncbi:PEP-CTERM sorting domain-containing protein [Tautonia plasticadhaerens]|uniref:PEP-CTERM motif protein n=1 Tax=Tautonia plasticadhaerens TaxID=2527974 RepID=A0A518GZ36_9BACT|nr:PEP-CTERM sorting domain-containing protein [Tautonia plasticadhaerens]QDV33874.1 PEP-CTERM motif protein [Tautonia plasticadhaerens]